MKIQIQWLGGAGLMLACDGFKTVLDPIEYTRGKQIVFPGFSSKILQDSHVLSDEEKDGIRAILLTHDHKDHFDKAALATYPKEASVITAGNMKATVHSMGFQDVQSLRSGKFAELEQDGIRLAVMAYKTRHCSNGWFSPFIKGGNGYTLEWMREEEDPYRIVVTGDSLPTSALMKHIENVHPHLIIVFAGAAHPGNGRLAKMTGRLTCGKKEVQIIAEAFPNSRVIPVHWGNMSHYRESYNAMSFIRQENVRLVEVGDSLEIER